MEKVKNILPTRSFFSGALLMTFITVTALVSICGIMDKMHKHKIELIKLKCK
jgi:hypothetical protein